MILRKMLGPVRMPAREQFATSFVSEKLDDKGSGTGADRLYQACAEFNLPNPVESIPAFLWLCEKLGTTYLPAQADISAIAAAYVEDVALKNSQCQCQFQGALLKVIKAWSQSQKPPDHCEWEQFDAFLDQVERLLEVPK